VKKLTATFLTVLICLTSNVVWGETVNFKDLVYKQPFYYKEFSYIPFWPNKPFTGKAEGKGTGEIINGRNEGFWQWRHDNGQVYSEGHYKNGNQNGLWKEYSKNGILFIKGHFKDGEMHGLFLWYDDNGRLEGRSKYHYGEQVGECSGVC